VREELPVLAFLAAAVLLFFWPIWLAGYTFPQGGGDLFGQLYPVWSYVARWLRRGVFPLWSTQLMAGDPIIAEAQYGLLNPLNWPLFLFSPIPRWMLLFRDAFTLWLAGTGLYLYLRRSPVWRLSRAAGVVGAVAFTFSSPFVTHLGHPQFNDVMAWLPWVLWGIDGAARRMRSVLPAGLALAALLLAGHGQAALYAVLTIGAYALWQVATGGVRRAPKRAARLLLVALLAGALAAPAILPGMERLPYSDRSLVPPEERRGYELPLAMWIDFVSPDFHGQGMREFWAPWDRVESGYAGAVALFLALLGLAANLRRPRGWFLLLLATGAFLFALGYEGPLYTHLAPLPFFAETWKTARIVYLVSFAVAVGAALGVQALQRGPSALTRSWFILLLVLALLLWLGAPAFVARVPGGVERLRALTGLRFAAALALLTALLGAYMTRLPALGRAGLVGLLLVELIAVGAFAETDPPAPPAVAHEGALAFLRADPGWFRIDVDAAATGIWSPARLLAEGFEVARGTGNPMEIFLYNQFYWQIPRKDAPAYSTLGVKYIIVPDGALPGGEKIWPVYEDDPLIDVHLNTNSTNRAWLVYETRPVSTLEEAYALVFDGEFDPHQEAVVQGGRALTEPGEGHLEVLAYGPNRAAFRVETTEPALLVLNDLHYPGWRARLDGEPAPLRRTNVIFRGIEIPPGVHEVEMRFFPTPLRLGVGLALAALLTLAVGAGERRLLSRWR
jgi:hypothetical protein